jgi:hypothetical protein
MSGMITPVAAQHLLVTFQTTLAERAEPGADDTLSAPVERSTRGALVIEENVRRHLPLVAVMPLLHCLLSRISS